MKKKSRFYFVVFAATLSSLTFATEAQIRPVYYDLPDAINVLDITPAQLAFQEYYDHAMQQITNGADISDYFVVEYAADADDAVEQLLGDITYDQGTPYNDKCPIISGRRAVTGCVATAMAQVMRYYTYPACGKGKVTYSGGAGGAKTIDLADYPFDWKNILNDYSQGYSDAQADAVATLMLACGASLNMQYSPDGSGINTKFVPAAMRDNFGFDSQIAFLDASLDSDPQWLIENDWAPAMRKEFRKGHPVIYSGFPAVGKTGHCFVIDGYKVIDGVYYYHVNWGWAGAMNGYYLLTNLKPSASGESYSGYGCTMVYNIAPPNWSAVDDVDASTSMGIDISAPIYTILGTTVSVEQMTHGNIYIQKGKKIFY